MIIIHWTRQIKEVLSGQESLDSMEGNGPLDELEFWRARCEDLSGLTKQLDQPGVQQVVTILQQAKSSYLPPFLKLTKQIQVIMLLVIICMVCCMSYATQHAHTHIHRRVPHGGHGPYTFYNFSIGIEFLSYKNNSLKPLCPPVMSAFLCPCTHTYTQLHAHTDICVHTHTCTHIQTHAHTNTHTHVVTCIHRLHV